MNIKLQFSQLLLVSFLVACGGVKGADSSISQQEASYTTSFTTSSTSNSTSSSAPSPTPTPAATATPSVEPTAPPNSTVIADGGTLVIDTDVNNAKFWAGDNEGAAVGSMSITQVEHPRFSKAIRINASNPAGAFWNGQLTFPISTSFKNGDVVLVHFFMRSIQNSYESGNSFVTVFLEDIGDYDKYFTREVTASFDWVEYFIPATVTEAQTGGNVELKFGFGAGDRAQTFEIAGVELYNYGDVDISQLPSTKPTYEGRANDASWRAEAAARIEQYRKSDFQITVLDTSGNPVSGVNIDINFLKHAYHFGSVTVGHVLARNDSDGIMYKQKVLELFNQSGPENDLKWAPWVGEWGSTNFNQQQTLAGLQWLRDNGLYTRGHVMVWPSKRNLPNLIQDLLPEGDPASADPAAKQVVLDHIDDIAGATASYLDEWDVLNEPYDNHYLMDAFGNSVMVDWFNRARANLPTQKLYLNDYSILSAGGHNAAHQQHYEDTIRYLLDNNAAITGMGMQGHFGDSPTGIDQVYSILERYHSAFPNLDIRITEFDVSTEDQDLQADYTRDFLTIVFSHPATVGVQLWGFWAGAHFSSEAALYTLDWQEKPNAESWKNQIYKQWWSDFEGTTNEQGVFTERGFYGDYEINITVDDNTQTFNFSLEKGANNTFTFTLTP